MATVATNVAADDEDFDNAALWAVVDSAAAAYLRSAAAKSDNLLPLKHQLPSSSNVKFPKCPQNPHFGSDMPLTHCLFGMFPSVSSFKDYQRAAMAILEKTDCTVISGRKCIKKSGWRKISFYFNVSYEIRDKNIQFDDQRRNVFRAEFVVRAHMQGGRYSDGWGSCECHEKRFSKPNHDIPSTAETRAKNRACQDLLGIGDSCDV